MEPNGPLLSHFTLSRVINLEGSIWFPNYPSFRWGPPGTPSRSLVVPGPLVENHCFKLILHHCPSVRQWSVDWDLEGNGDDGGVRGG